MDSAHNKISTTTSHRGTKLYDIERLVVAVVTS